MPYPAGTTAVAVAARSAREAARDRDAEEKAHGQMERTDGHRSGRAERGMPYDSPPTRGARCPRQLPPGAPDLLCGLESAHNKRRKGGKP
jgi:hypothetical protein